MTIFKQYSSSSNAATGFIFSCLLFAMIFLTRRGAVYYWSILYYTMEAKLKNLRFFSHKNHEMKIVPENCRSLVDLFMCENFQNTAAACSKRLLAGCFKSFSHLRALLFCRAEFRFCHIFMCQFLEFSWSSRIALQCFECNIPLIGQFSKQQMAFLTSKIIFYCLI